LFFLPPHAPDRNPDELVCKHLKADTVGRTAVTSKENFAKKVRRSMRDLQNDTRKIISFFPNPLLEYAA
jgi:transposase